jgi:hypothetical protein
MVINQSLTVLQTIKNMKGAFNCWIPAFVIILLVLLPIILSGETKEK